MGQDCASTSYVEIGTSVLWWWGCETGQKLCNKCPSPSKSYNILRTRSTNFASELLPMRKKAGPPESPGRHIANSVTCNAQGEQRQGEAQPGQGNVTDPQEGGKLWPLHAPSVKLKGPSLKRSPWREDEGWLPHMQGASTENSESWHWGGGGWKFSFNGYVLY